MEIKLNEVKIKDLFEGYHDNDEEGVVGYSGKLDIRPKYQREFIYNMNEQVEVINSILHNFPLNVMYWLKTKEGNYELLDGQQRTLSICHFLNNEFSIPNGDSIDYFHSLTENKKQQILDYKLMVYFCEGTEDEVYEWFKIINIAGEKLTNQELRNALYTGEWLTDAKRHFSRNNCAALGYGDDYISGKAIRQEVLEKVLKWISDRDNIELKDYMARHKDDKDANELWNYYVTVIDWAKRLFPEKRPELKSVEWGILFNKYESKMKNINTNDLSAKVKELMADDDVTSKSGIYYYLITDDERYLNIRKFSDSMKRSAYERQNGMCPICGEHYEIDEMEGDHITPWHDGGKTTTDNLQMLCKECNRRKSGI